MDGHTFHGSWFTGMFHLFKKITGRFFADWMYVCVRACARARACLCAYVCVSDPLFIQFALDSCYAVHINALSI